MPEIKIIDSEDPEIKRMLVRGVRAFNEPMFGNFGDGYDFTVSMHEQGELVGGILGYIGDYYCKITWVFVDEKFRGNGLGKKMLNQFLDYAKAKGCKEFHVDTYNPAAREFYKSCGFMHVATIPQWLKNSDCYFLKIKV